MGSCHASKSKGPKEQEVKIGGGEDGQCTWCVLNGEAVQNLQTSTGWEMKFKVDPDGNIAGGNKNDGEKNAQKKTYKGTFKEGKLDAVAYFEDGAEIKYDGITEGSLLKVTCVVVKGSDAFSLGDKSNCQGTVRFL